MPTRVLIADDSPFVCRLLAGYLKAAAGVEVAGVAHTGEEAVELTARLRPDVVTLDLTMPGAGGMAALRRIMAEAPTPVLLLTGVSRDAAAVALQALAVGAVDVLPKYTPGKTTDPAGLRQQFVTKVLQAAAVRVVRSLPVPETAARLRIAFARPSRAPVRRSSPHRGPTGRVLVIGASTGGPIAVRELLAGLSTDFPAAVVVVQHLPPLFTRSFADQLDRHTPLAVREAADGDRLRAGFALVAPGDRHLIVRADGRVWLTENPAVNGHRPSIDVTLRSAAAVFGRRATGVLLTGMGDDGAEGLLAVRAAGGRTFAQDAVTAAVNGMPQRAIDLNAAECVDTPAGIAARLLASHSLFNTNEARE